jgi:hypothetical protein
MVRIRYLVVFIIALFLAQAVPALSQDAVNISESGRETEYPSMAANQRGEILVIWSDAGYMSYRVFTNGGWWGVQRFPYASGYDLCCQLEVDSNGVFHLTYRGNERDIYYSTFTTGGGWSEPEAVNDDSQNSAWNKMVIEGNRIYVMWFQEVGNYDEPEIVMNSKTIGGRWPDSYENVSRNANRADIHPAFAVVDGYVYACYMEGFEGNWDIVFAEKTDGVWRTPYWLGWGHWPAIAADRYHNLYVLFPSGYRMYCSERINGQWQTTDLTPGNAEKGFVDIKVKHDLVVAVWSNFTPYGISIYYRIKAVGGSWGEAVELHPGKEASYPVLSIDDQGTAHCIWLDQGNGGYSDVYYKSFSLSKPSLPTIQVDKTYIAFTANEGETKKDVFRVKNSGAGTLNYSLSSNSAWLSVSPTSGSSTGEWDDIVLIANSANMNAGTHSGVITIDAPGATNTPARVTVSMTVKESPPAIQLDRDSLSFAATEGERNPEDQGFRIRNSGGGLLSYSLTSNASWLKIWPAQGDSTGEWDTAGVSVDISGLEVGSYQGQITISSPKATNAPQKVIAYLKVNLPPYPYQPVNVQKQEADLAGLMIKIFVNRVTWQNNPKNTPYFAVTKFRVYRKKAGQSDSSLTLIGEVDNREPLAFEDQFSTQRDRDESLYQVTAVDDQGRESKRTATSARGGVLMPGTPLKSSPAKKKLAAGTSPGKKIY